MKVDRSSLDREEVRRRLRESCTPIDAGRPVLEPWVPAAVLIGLVARPQGPHIVLTHRTAHLTNHPAQISLPGGRVEATDDGPAAAALREAFEEIGLAPGKVDLLGCLPTYDTVSGFCVYPFVGWIEPPVEFTIDAYEVEEVFEVPLAFVLDPANHRRESTVFRGERHEFWVLAYPGHRIWGATAGILVCLARALA
jgi:8-oxo-dGTP pyrophosphatase MutT (NUDIX family)